MRPLPEPTPIGPTFPWTRREVLGLVFLLAIAAAWAAVTGGWGVDSKDPDRVRIVEVNQ